MLRRVSLLRLDTTSMSSSDDREEMEVDILAVTPTPTILVPSQLTPGEKMYYCQRCLNHNEFHPRKGHKPYCSYSNCSCPNCSMVETRRQLNNKLKGPGGNKGDKRSPGEKKERTPNCARCSAHGIVAALRGHKKTNCPFYMCECEKCQLVVSRRAVMARQIKLRRNQQRARLLGEGRQSIDSNTDSSSSESARSPSPEIITIPPMPLIQPMPMRPLPMPIMPRLPPQVHFNRIPTVSTTFLSTMANLNHFLQSNPGMVEFIFTVMNQANHQQ